MSMTVQPIILAGGGGTRLWPLSRGYYPKQFLSLMDEQSMLQKTLTRLDNLPGDLTIQSSIVLTNEEQRFLVAEHARQIHHELADIILEPIGRNTAPALTAAAMAVNDPDSILLVMPSDHIIQDVTSFHQQLMKAIELAKDDYLVTFGIQPDKPETGYGYIKTADSITTDCYEIDRFVEKPAMEKAQEYCDSGDYYWNSGLFVMKSSTWLQAISQFEPEIYQQCSNAVQSASKDGDFFRLDAESFSQSPDNSIDYAVMERVSDSEQFKGALVTLDVGWSDIGSWFSVWNIKQKDEQQNAINGDVVTIDTQNSLIHADHKLVATVGIKDTVIIETSDAVLVADKNQAQDIKKIVEILKSQDREESLLHRKVYRPWGSYEGLEVGENFQVKRLIVDPGKKISLQLHHKRAEHWVVVSGVATVTVGENIIHLQENQSTFIPMGVKHRLENKQDVALEVIEVQCGSYLGEDDIVRFDDDFGRIEKH